MQTMTRNWMPQPERVYGTRLCIDTPFPDAVCGTWAPGAYDGRRPAGTSG